jgi:hypothetical protein
MDALHAGKSAGACRGHPQRHITSRPLAGGHAPHDTVEQPHALMHWFASRQNGAGGVQGGGMHPGNPVPGQNETRTRLSGQIPASGKGMRHDGAVPPQRLTEASSR